ncbi:MAG: ATP-binding protein [Candidatus Saganbacteria bacterium]|nr:ATP-binding protein [Candidatus Saganbacteria bacterium]
MYESINNFEDLENLIKAEIRESEVVEYKGAKAKFSESDKKEISKDVSAFANSSGGIIIYGIETDNDDKTKPKHITGISNANIESFDRIVNASVSKPIKGIDKKIIERDHKCMIVYIPQSEDAPHQNSVDKKYYRRAGTESVPMEHYLIDLFYGRRYGPILEIQVQNREQIDFSKLQFGPDGWSQPISLRIGVLNHGKRIGKYVEIVLLFPNDKKVSVPVTGRWRNIDTFYSGLGLQARQFTENNGVFHPTMLKNVLDVELRISKNFNREAEPLINWTIFADEMTLKKGLYYLKS